MEQAGIDFIEAKKRWRAINQAFLICIETGKERVLSSPADELLHDALRFTEEYQNLCFTKYGGMIHHKPATIPGQPSGYLETRELAVAKFGTLNESWPIGERPQWSVVYFKQQPKINLSCT